MMFQWYSADGAAVHPLLVVMLALAMDVALGDPPRLWERIPHPVAVFGGLISFFERKLNRPQRSDRARFWRGCLPPLFWSHWRASQDTPCSGCAHKSITAGSPVH